MLPAAASVAFATGDSPLSPDQRVELLGQISGSVLHEFNNILTVITGTIDMLAESVADRPDLAGVARLIDDAAFRGARLTSQLIGFDRGQPPRPREADLQVLLGDAVRLLRPLLGRRIEVGVDPVPEPLRGIVDPGLLLMAILSVGCAIRPGSPDGTRLQIGAGTEQIAGDLSPSEERSPCVIITLSLLGPFPGQAAARPAADLRRSAELVRQSGGSLSTRRRSGDESLIEIRLPRPSG